MVDDRLIISVSSRLTTVKDDNDDDDDDDSDDDGGQRRRRKKDEKRDHKDRTKYRPPFLDHFDRAREKEILIDRHLRGGGGGGDGSSGERHLDDNDVNFTLNSLNNPSFEELLRQKGESMERRILNEASTTATANGGGTGGVESHFNTASSITTFSAVFVTFYLHYSFASVVSSVIIVTLCLLIFI